MNLWLFKEEPAHYSYGDLERDGQTLWSGVNNNLARKHLREVRTGDRIWFYHTGKEKAVVGEMVAVSDAQPYPPDDTAAVAVTVRAVRRLLAPVSLQTIKDDPRLTGWDLVRLPRLSIVPVSADQWQRVEELGQDGPPRKKGAR